MCSILFNTFTVHQEIIAEFHSPLLIIMFWYQTQMFSVYSKNQLISLAVQEVLERTFVSKPTCKHTKHLHRRKHRNPQHFTSLKTSLPEPSKEAISFLRAKMAAPTSCLMQMYAFKWSTSWCLLFYIQIKNLKRAEISHWWEGALISFRSECLH